MSLCINPHCLQPDHPGNDGSRFCQSCGSDLVLQGRYRVMRLLSDKSGFGKVYEAFERSTPKLLKVLKEAYHQHAKAIELFQQEAMVLSQLQHPGVPAIEPNGYFQLVPRGSNQPVHCIVMEKVDGLNLREWMKQQGNHPISEKQALNWLKQLAAILNLVHQKNYFHRDIKPENIMLRSSGQLVLVDFGAAREMTYTYLAQLGGTGSITRISSAGYTPPEQEKGQAVPQSDFYALGCTFVYLLTGQQPTDGSIYNPQTNEFLWRKFAPQVSPPLANFIDKLIAPRVADRPTNTQEILQELAQLEQTLSQALLMKPLSFGALLHPNPPTVVQSHLPTTIYRNTKWLLGGAIALAIGLGSYGAWQISRSMQPQGVGDVQQAIEVTQTLTGHTSYINALVITPDGGSVISASADKTIKIWNLETGQVVRTLTGHTSFVNALAISPDGQTLVSGGADRTIMIWNLETGEPLHTLNGDFGFINALSISFNGKLLASGGDDGVVRIWDIATGAERNVLTGHSGAINPNALVFSPDGQTVISGSADTTIHIWDLARGQLRRTIATNSGFVNTIALSPDGQTLYSGGVDRTIKVWDVTTGQELGKFVGHSGFINDLALSPDGQQLISSSADQTIKIWDTATATLRYTLTGYGTHINYFVVSPGWQTLLSGSGDRVIRVWDLPK
ncbi:serine/threonine protein kinase [Oculatella sp. LEGE 06141]|uniref:serine/threonine-protein kinase n=1 Tax=Oculatella sp. LEGE 06141 TaxID=1828648 RepID=UPI00187EF4A9|nr:serine/threonine-protein kinase [Oculatella sp. LEGE 06141]MBE9179672.1 serine/threonine protein kinase [Oculatella sp. LEGE 06141]